jgi:Fic family protein
MTYIHELEDWPDFRWDEALIGEKLAALRHRQGRLLGRMEALGFALRSEAVLRTLTADVIRTMIRFAHHSPAASASTSAR